MNTLTIIKNGFIQNPGCPQVKADIAIFENKIIELSENQEFEIAKNYDSVEYIDAEGLIIAPGLIDQHIHGGYGVDFNNATAEEMISLAKMLPGHGITSILATIMTDSQENIQHQINEISLAIENLALNHEKATSILGIHLEGPFLNPEYKGIHSDNYILKPTVENFKKFENKNIKIVSYAPELDDNWEFTRYLTQKNIIPSAGHSKATHEETNTALQLGLRQTTHLFNAMPPLHHRNPGILGESLTNDEIYVEVIADNEHLHPIIIDLILKSKPKSKIIFISDSLPLNHSSEDYLIFGGQKIYRKNNRAVNENGTFAGSLSFLDDNLRKNINKINLSEYLQFASLNPARNLGLKTKGFIDKGFDADLVLWDKNLKIKKTIVSGKIVYSD